jgi:hypothetical protein
MKVKIKIKRKKWFQINLKQINRNYNKWKPEDNIEWEDIRDRILEEEMVILLQIVKMIVNNKFKI